MIRRVEEQPQESESSLAEDSLESVHVLTIHKAKGLEFPVVILPGLHQGTGGQGRSRLIGHDWSSGLYGLWLADGKVQTLGSVLVQSKQQVREAAEQRRVLYVGMTRAKDRLILSGGVTGRPGQDTVLSLLEEIVQAGLGDPEVVQLTIGDATITQTIMAAHAPSYLPRFGWAGGLKFTDHDSLIVETWAGRTERWHEARERPRSLTPSGMDDTRTVRRQGRGRQVCEGRSRRISQVIGQLAHRLLEQWDYLASTAEFPRLIATLCRSQLPPDCEPDRVRIQADLEKLFDAFGRSEPYRLLQRAELLGREVPFSIPWEQGQDQDRVRDLPSGQVMTGTVDVVYRLDGQVWVGDYKTDDMGRDELQELVHRYAWQAQVYRTAVRQALAIDSVGFQFIVLRQGLMIPG
jgi:ATP-dependent helicase/nuclease subunit A